MRMLNWVNRAIVVVVLFLVFLVALGLAIAPGFTASLLRDWSAALAVDFLSAGHLAIAIVAVPVALAALALLVLELRLRRPAAVALAGEPGARLAAETIIDRLRQDVEALPLVDQARPIVQPRRRSVDVQLMVTTAPQVDVPAKAAEISEVARQTIERLGLKLGRLNVQLSDSTRAWPRADDGEVGAGGQGPAIGDKGIGG